MIRYALAIFLSAFLLFQVQPLVGKYILPWFGGTPAVWTACMLFFQVSLLAGYCYAHLLASHLSPRVQAVVHLILLGAALIVLPIIPDPAWKPTSDDIPTLRILLLLAVTVGTPYVLLSATGPLLQAWFSRVHSGRSPYRLYALSNAGSLLALLSYPFMFERFLRLKTQAWTWSIGYAVFAALCACCAVRLLSPRLPTASPSGIADPPEDPPEPKLAFARKARRRIQPAEPAPPTPLNIFLWIALAACGSNMLLATTNQLCQDVAVVPLLWVLPLSLYLISFIICFDNPRWYVRWLYTPVLFVAAAGATVMLYEGVDAPLKLQVGVYSVVLLACCMSCHGELVQLKPEPRHLTLFYLMVSVGGALGGVFVAIVAPFVFDGFWEYHAGLLGCLLLILFVVVRDHPVPTWFSPPIPRAILVCAGIASAVIGTVVLVYYLGHHVTGRQENVLAVGRNFYGVLRVKEYNKDNAEWHSRSLIHGRIQHGEQFVADSNGRRHTSYFGRESGIGIAIRHHPRRHSPDRQFRMGVVGLGVGTIASFSRESDYLRFYEINPMVVRFSGEYFTYMRGARERGVDVDVFPGDARVVMERQIRRAENQQFDVLAIDAFSSDAIPIHLLTEECFNVYWDHIKPDGILAVHISNRFLDLSPVVRKLAEINGKQTCSVKASENEEEGTSSCDWVLVTGNRRFIESEPVRKASRPWPEDAPEPLLWTDDFSNLFSVLE